MAIYLCLPIAIVFSLLLTPLARRFALRIGAVDYPGERKIHAAPIPRLGGLGVVVAGVLTACVISGFAPLVGEDVLPAIRTWYPLLLGGIPVLGIGIWDDLRPVPAWLKFVFQGIAAGVAIGFGIRIDHITLLGGESIRLGFIALPLTFVWIVGITNAFNLVDGLDGLAAGLASISAGALILIACLHNSPEDSMILLVLLGALLGFLPYNFNPATIFLGDSGSLSAGYILAVTAITGSQKEATALAVVIPLLIFGLPIIDTILSMTRRFIGSLQVLKLQHASLKEQIRGAKSMFQPDQKHIHHRLLALGFSHRNAVLVLYASALSLSLLALLSVLAQYRNAGMILIAIGLATYIGIRKLGYTEVTFLNTGMLLRWYDFLTFNRLFFLGCVDMVLIAASYWGALLLKYDMPWSADLRLWSLGIFPLVLVVQLAVLHLLGLYRGVWRAADISDLIHVASVTFPAVAISYIMALVSLPPVDTLRFFLLDAILFSASMVGIRSAYRVLDYLRQRTNLVGKVTLIYGAGRGGQLVLRELLQNPSAGLSPIGFIDDDPALQDRMVNAMPILGSATDLSALITAQSVACLVISTQHIQKDRLTEVIHTCRHHSVTILRSHLTLEPLA